MTIASADDSAIRLPGTAGAGQDPHAETPTYLASAAHEAAMQGMVRGLRDHARLLVLTGEPDAGKTTLLKRLCAELAVAMQPVLCPGSGLDFSQVLGFLCTELGFTRASPTRDSEIAALTGYLSGAARRPVLLLVDDADRLQGDALEDLLRLADGMDRGALPLHLVVSGSPGLQPMLRRERTTHACVATATLVRIARLSRVEAAAFVERLVTGCDGRDRAPLPAATVNRILDAAGGNAGRLVALCTGCPPGADRPPRTLIAPMGGDVNDDPRALTFPPPSQADAPGAPAGVRAAPSASSPASPQAPPKGVIGRPGRTGALAALLGVAMATVLGVGVWQFAGREAHEPDAAWPPVASGQETAVSMVDVRALVEPPSRPALPVPAPGPVSGPMPGEALPANEATLSPPPVAVAERGDGLGTEPLPQPASSPEMIPTPGIPPSPQRNAAPAPVAIAGAASADADETALGTNLARARTAMSRQALTTPREDSVVKWAEAALSMSPGNPAAREMLHQVVDTYLRWSNRDLDRGSLEAAKRYLERARSVRRHATKDQIAAMQVLDDAIAVRIRADARETARASRRKDTGHQTEMEAPQWFKSLEGWLQGLPLPQKDR